MPSLSDLCPVRLATAEYIEKLSLAAASGSPEAWPILVALLEGGKVPLPSEDLATTADSIRWAHATLLRRLEPRPPKRRRKWLCLLGPAYSSGLCVLCGVPVHSRLRHGEQREARPPIPRAPLLRGAPMSPMTRPLPVRLQAGHPPPTQ